MVQTAVEMIEGRVDGKDTASLRQFGRCSRLGDTSGWPSPNQLNNQYSSKLYALK